MSSKGRAFVDHLLDQVGDRVQQGTEVAADAPDSKTWDSSELVEWASGQAGAPLPDGSWRQFNHLAASGNAVDPEVALRTPGALLFKFSSDPAKGIPAERQVMVSLGDGRVVDASGRTVQVVAANAHEFTHAATVPDLEMDAAEAAAWVGELDARLRGDAPPADAGADPTPTPAAPAPVAPSTPTTPSTPPVEAVPADPVAERKAALDASQRAEQLRSEVRAGEARKAGLEADADRFRHDAQQRRDASRAARDAAETATREAADLDGDARDAKVAESNRLAAEADRLDQEATTLDGRAGDATTWAERAQSGIDALTAQAADAQNEAARHWTASNHAIDARTPQTALDGAPAYEDVPVLDVPAAPAGAATVDDVRTWLRGREAAEASRQTAAAQHHRSAAELDDIAETKRALATDSRARAGALDDAIEGEQARITTLETRHAAAQAQADRLSDEMIEEQAHFEQLKARNDPGAAAASQRVDDLMRQQMSWQSQAHDLGERITGARAAIAQHEADRADFTEVAGRLDDEARLASEASAREQELGTRLQAEADELDRGSDAIERTLDEAVQRGVATHLQIEVDGVSIQVDLPGRNPSDLGPDEIDALGLPGASPSAANDTTDDGVGADDDGGSTDPGEAGTRAAADASGTDPVDATTLDAPGGDPTLDPLGADLATDLATIDASTDALTLDDASAPLGPTDDLGLGQPGFDDLGSDGSGFDDGSV